MASSPLSESLLLSIYNIFAKIEVATTSLKVCFRSNENILFGRRPRDLISPNLDGNSNSYKQIDRIVEESAVSNEIFIKSRY